MTRVAGEWLRSAVTQRIFDAIEADGHQVFAVGGCVRNALLGVPVSDVDMATDAHPETVMRLAEDAGLRAVPTGLEHGTVTVVAEGAGFEITTFRRDVETDGRRAVVAFAECLEEDAHRRDFTINALYADRHGVVTDVVGGLADIAARRLRFIDDPAQRIREDYLRILRYFRFLAWYGDPEAGMDPEALAAIAENLYGMASLSRERVTAELIKLLSAHDPAWCVAAMDRIGVLDAVLPGARGDWLGPLVHWEDYMGLAPNAIVRIVALAPEDVASCLRLSKAQIRSFEALRAACGSGQGIAELAYRHGRDFALHVAALRAALLDQPVAPSVENEASLGETVTFPVKASDLANCYSGKALGDHLRRLERRWIDSRFTLGKAALLSDGD